MTFARVFYLIEPSASLAVESGFKLKAHEAIIVHERRNWGVLKDTYKHLRLLFLPEQLYLSCTQEEAMDLGCHHVHLSSTDNSSKRRDCVVMRSVHVGDSLREADAYLFGPVFDSISKPGYRGVGLHELKTFLARTTIPVIGIGGIRKHNMNEVMDVGAHGVAMMGMPTDAV